MQDETKFLELTVVNLGQAHPELFKLDSVKRVSSNGLNGSFVKLDDGTSFNVTEKYHRLREILGVR